MINKRDDKTKKIKSNILFVLVVISLVSLITFFAVKSWPKAQIELADDDEDGVPNYKDQCANTPIGVAVDFYGCETTKEAGIEKPTTVGEETVPDEVEGGRCRETDNGRDIWVKGICDDGIENKDYCKDNFKGILYEYECSNNICIENEIDCEHYSALCYRGECIEETRDTDEDGYPDLDEYEDGTDPEDSESYPESDVPPDNDNDGIPDNIDPDDDNDGFTDDEETQHGTNPNDSNDFPQEDCDSICGSGYDGGRELNIQCVTEETLVTSTDGTKCCCHSLTEYRCWTDDSEFSCYAQPGWHWRDSALYISSTDCQAACKADYLEAEKAECERQRVFLHYENGIYAPAFDADSCTEHAQSQCDYSGRYWEDIDKCCLWNCEIETGWSSGDIITTSNGMVGLAPGESVIRTVYLGGYELEGEEICIETYRKITFYDETNTLPNPSNMIYLYVDPSIGTPFTFADPFDSTWQTFIEYTTTIPFSGSYGYTYAVPFEFEFVSDINLQAFYNYGLTFKIC